MIYSIIVVMSNYASSFENVSRQLNDNLFGNIGVKSIEDLTAFPEHLLNDDGSICARNAPELAEHFTRISFNQILHIKLEKNCKQNVLDSISKLEKSNYVVYVGPDFILTGFTVNPNDPRLSEQWGLLGINGISASEAWNITKGSRNIRVGVIDSGIAFHDDLNPVGNSNVITGWDFFYNNAVTNDDIGGHGTLTAGIIGAVGDNGRGISGVAQKVTLVPLQTAYDTSGNGWHYTYFYKDFCNSLR